MPRMSVYDVAVVGAGPIGIACARECAERGLRVALIDEGPILGAMYCYPSNMRFFSTADRLEICGIPFPSVNPQPTRNEGLSYYRLVAQHALIDWHLYQKVTGILGATGDFAICTERAEIHARRVVMATGFFKDQFCSMCQVRTYPM